jgi:microsomal dipeptidase-like Zn-dependent dipeptidase
LTERLVERDFADDEIRKVLGGNLLRVYRQGTSIAWGAS